MIQDRFWSFEYETPEYLKKSSRVIPEWEIPFDLKTMGEIDLFKDHPSFPYFRDKWIMIWRQVYEREKEKFPHGFWAVREYNESGYLNGYLRALVISKYLLDKHLKDPLTLRNSFFYKYKLATPLKNFFRDNKVLIVMMLYPGKYNTWDFKFIPRYTFNPDHTGMTHTSRKMLETMLKNMLEKTLGEALRRKNLREKINLNFPDDVICLTWNDINDVHGLEKDFKNIMDLLKYVFGDRFNPVYRPRMPKMDKAKFRKAGREEIYNVLLNDFDQSGEENLKEYIYSIFNSDWYREKGFFRFMTSHTNGLLIDIFKNKKVILEPLFFRNKPLFWFKDEDGKINFEIIREYLYLIASELEYDDPRTQFEERDLSLRGGTNLVKYYNHDYFPSKNEWKVISNIYMNRVEKGLLIKKKEILLKTAPKVGTSDFVMEGNKYRCPVSSCESKIILRHRARHLREVHWIDTCISCEYCSVRVNDTTELADHVRDTHKNLFRCKNTVNCDYAADNISAVEIHMRRKKCASVLGLKGKYHCDTNMEDHPSRSVYRAESPKEWEWHQKFYHDKNYFEGDLDITYERVGAYVADGGDGLEIIDISDPENPVEVGEFYDDRSAYSVDVEGSLVFVADGEWVEIFDVSDKSAPVRLGDYYDEDYGNTMDLAVSGPYIYASDGTEVIDILTWISKPSSPLNLELLDNHDSSVTITWEASLYDGSDSLEYRVYRGTSIDNLLLLTTVGDYSYTDATVTKGTEYFYGISALNRLHESNLTDAISVTPTSSATAPQNLILNLDTANHVEITWEAPIDNGGLPSADYIVYRGSSADVLSELTTVNSTLEYLDSTVAPGTTYFYAVSAVNDVGEGDLSSIESISTNDYPDAPHNLTLLYENDNVTISWDAPLDDGGSEILNYIIYRGLSADNLTELITLSGSTISYNDSTVESELTYYYAASAVNGVGEGDLTTVLEITIPEAGSAVVIIVVVVIVAGVATVVVVKKKGLI
ncbi:MAG: hypothetical protein GPJ54_00065 [Candidatus Heimdallarchaeota archaeon]|nr:hypothetical protein [Candidatus Heimdallarchaeota archaeon]